MFAFHKLIIFKRNELLDNLVIITILKNKGVTTNWQMLILLTPKVNLGFPSGSVVKNPSANARGVGSIPGSGRFPEEGKSNPLQYSCLGNLKDRGTWQGTVPWGCRRVRHDLAR